MAVGFGCSARLDALEKMPALHDEWLIGRKLDRLANRPLHDELPLHEVDPLIVNLQLVGLPNVIEYSHSFLADDYQFLLLVRMQPAYEQVSAGAPVEQHGRYRHVGDIRL